MSRGSLYQTAVLAVALSITACTGRPGDRSLTSVDIPEAPSLTRSGGGGTTTLSSPGWQAQARELAGANNMSPLAATRVYAALSVAQYAAVKSTDHAHGAGKNGRRALEEQRGAVAGASAQVLTFFFPAAAATLEQRVLTEADMSPANKRPHFTRGLALGRRAGTAVVDRTKTDQFTTPWTGTVPTGPGKWIANGPPAGATFGGVKPYVMTSGSQFRSPPPPAFGSPAFVTDLTQIKTMDVNRTPAQKEIAIYWNFPTGTFTPPGYWNLTASNYIEAYRLNEREATHAFAMTGVAMMDALIGCWDAKYHYWVARPSQADPTITMTFGLPNHPSYPSGHSCSSAAAAKVLAHLFPGRAREVDGWVNDAGLSRMYAGIHYRFDITAGERLGDAVGRLVIARDRHVGLLRAIR